MIRLQNVSKRYGDKDSLSHVNLHIPQGSFVFLTGHSGAGKSTLLKLLAAIERPTQGQVWVNDQEVGRMKPRQIPHFRRELGIVFQNHQLLFDRSVYDNVALPLIISGYDPRQISRRVHAALNKVGLLHQQHQNPITLSGGEQQRVGIARAVVNRPKLLLADEPTGNLDPELARDIMRLFFDFNQVGVTVLLASHDWNLIQRIRAPILSLKGGRLVHNDLSGEEKPA